MSCKAWMSAFGAMFSIVAMAGAKAPATVHADEQYVGVRQGGDGHWTDNAGKWNRDAKDRSTFAEGEGVSVSTSGKELYFRPWIEKNKSCINKYSNNSLLTFEGKVSFTAYRDGSELDDFAAMGPKAALVLREKGDGTTNLTFAAWRFSTQTWGGEQTGLWVDLSAPGLKPEEDHAYTFKMESDMGCRPPRVRYSIDGQPLATARGETWLAAKPTQGQKGLQPEIAPTNSISHIGFCGRGAIGKFTLSEALEAVERADVTVPRLGAPKVGDAVTFEAAAKAGQTLGDELTCQWYRTDASGAREAIAGATGASYAFTEDDYGHWVEVDVSDGNGYAGTGRIWFSDIPVAYIDVDGGEWPYDGGYNGREQTESIVRPDCNADLLLTGDPQDPDHAECQYDTHQKDKKGKELGQITIHVRGNSTAYLEKKPYKIKLGTKTDLFGLGGGTASKHWTLLANFADDSHMRNKVYYDLSEHLGLVHMTSTWVDVVMNGQYIGVYQLCQQIRVAKERVNVYSWDDALESIAEKSQEANPALTNDVIDADMAISDLEDFLETNCVWMSTGKFTYKDVPYTVQAKDKKKNGPDGKGGIDVYWKNFSDDITGGYIFEPDEKKITNIGYNPAASNFCQTNRNEKGSMNVIHMTLGTPEFGFTDPNVRQYVWDLWAYMSQCWMSGTGYGPDGRHYTETCDLDTMVGYWLAHQIGGNGDSGLHSRYAYKDRQGKVFFGPAWDFDLVGRSTTVVTDANGRSHYKPSGRSSWSPGGAVGNYAGYWTADPYFSFKARERYLAIRDKIEEVMRDGGLIDRHRARLAHAARANDVRWSTPYGFEGDGDEMGAVELFKSYFKACVTWLDKQFATVGNIVTEASKTVGDNNSTTAANLRYVRNKNLAVTFPDAQAVADSPDAKASTGVSDVHQQAVPGTGLRVEVSVPTGVSAADVLVYVNGLSNSVQTVSAQKASFTLPAKDFRIRQTNFVSVDARDASGKTVARNVALVGRDPRGAVFFLVGP